MSVAPTCMYANDAFDKGENIGESPYECADIDNKESSETSHQDICNNNKTAKLLALLYLVTVGISISLAVMHFQLQSSWRQEAEKSRGNFLKIGEAIIHLQNQTQDSIEKLNNISAGGKSAALISQLSEEKLLIRSMQTEIDVFNTAISNLQKIQRNLVLNKLWGWQKSGNFIYKYFTEHVTYSTARARCQSYGGRLASAILRNSEAVSIIIQRNYIGAKSTAINPWIGYDDISREGKWQWTDGGGANSLVVWDYGQPDSTGNEDCGEIWESRQGKLVINDAPCGQTQSYLCEIPFPEIAL